jgi:hypothetical protein
VWIDSAVVEENGLVGTEDRREFRNASEGFREPLVLMGHKQSHRSLHLFLVVCRPIYKTSRNQNLKFFWGARQTTITIFSGQESPESYEFVCQKIWIFYKNRVCEMLELEASIT